MAPSQWAGQSIGRCPPATCSTTPTVSDLFRRPNSQARNTVPECSEAAPIFHSANLSPHPLGGWVAVGESKNTFSTSSGQLGPAVVPSNHLK